MRAIALILGLTMATPAAAAVADEVQLPIGNRCTGDFIYMLESTRPAGHNWVRARVSTQVGYIVWDVHCESRRISEVIMTDNWAQAETAAGATAPGAGPVPSMLCATPGWEPRTISVICQFHDRQK